MPCIIDAFTRESLTIRIARKLKPADVIEALRALFVSRGIPAHMTSDNGPELLLLLFANRSPLLEPSRLHRTGKSG
jgi:hypothetical protein